MACQHILFEPGESRGSLLAEYEPETGAPVLFQAIVDTFEHRILAHKCLLRLNGDLVGITHYFFHPFIWYGQACYLQDLFTAEAARGQGAARALIEAVAAEAREKNATRLYWMTKEDNARARLLYDKLASFGGFIKYDYSL